MTDPGTSFVPDPPALPARPGGLAGRFWVDEVAELAALLNLTPPTSITNLLRAAAESGGDTPADASRPAGPGSAADTGSATDAARRRLFARGVLRVDAGQQLIMDDDAVAILTTICTPALVVTVSSGTVQAPRRRTIYSLPGGGIVETSRMLRGERIMHYLSLPNEAILPSLLQWTGLASRQARDPAASAASAAASASAASAAPAGLAVRSANAITVLHRPGGLLTVRLIAWNDCGAAGLWRVEQDAGRALYGRQGSGLAGQPAEHDLLDLDEPVTLTPISADGVLELIAAALP